MKKCELLAPAGSLEKLKIAILYGADAVYIGGEEFSLRVAADNFTPEEMREGIRFAHDRGKKVYVTANIIPHNRDIGKFADYAREIKELGADAVLVSDLGVFQEIHQAVPDLPIHISTQANNVNWRTVLAWYNMGAKRVVLARELTLGEIQEIRAHVPEECELEAFVHGAMCISYSGRCLLSNYMTHRDSNLGACSHPCRWKYSLMEEKRPGEYFPVYENENGTFIFNSKDLCMVDHIGDVLDSGIVSLKIEGRVKNELYVATVVRAYRQAIDAYYDGKPFPKQIYEELQKVSHREYSTGFYYGMEKEGAQIFASSTYIRNYDIVGIVRKVENGIVTVEQRNRFFVGDTVEIIQPNLPTVIENVPSMKNEEGEEISVAPHPQMILQIPFHGKVEPNALIRMEKKA